MDHIRVLEHLEGNGWNTKGYHKTLKGIYIWSDYAEENEVCRELFLVFQKDRILVCDTSTSGVYYRPIYDVTNLHDEVKAEVARRKLRKEHKEKFRNEIWEELIARVCDPSTALGKWLYMDATK